MFNLAYYNVFFPVCQEILSFSRKVFPKNARNAPRSVRQEGSGPEDVRERVGAILERRAARDHGRRTAVSTTGLWSEKTKPVSTVSTESARTFAETMNPSRT